MISQKLGDGLTDFGRDGGRLGVPHLLLQMSAKLPRTLISAGRGGMANSAYLPGAAQPGLGGPYQCHVGSASFCICFYFHTRGDHFVYLRMILTSAYLAGLGGDVNAKFPKQEHHNSPLTNEQLAKPSVVQFHWVVVGYIMGIPAVAVACDEPTQAASRNPTNNGASWINHCQPLMTID